MPTKSRAKDGDDLRLFACPNDDCDLFNQFDAGNLSVCERMGKDKAIRRLYCQRCGQRFSERQGSLMEYTKLPKNTIVRVIKCLGHGCSVEATADICEVDARTVARILERAGRRAEAFHQQQLDRLKEPLGAVELDELHGRVCQPPRKKGANARSGPESRMGGGLLDAVAAWVDTGFTRRWRSRRGS
jgi:transposase-like protein